MEEDYGGVQEERMLHSISVTEEIADWIMMPIKGKGAFQEFLWKLQSQLDYPNLTLGLHASDLGRIAQHIG
jgi:hypothetical protein